ncbi:MAG: hypothetical protein ACI8RP_000212 [Urechidicola sp.]|jgi:hypothetical protein
MLVYNEAFDIYHCTFRIINLLNRIEENKSVEIDRLRIWDFYLVFPNKLHEVSFSNNEKDIKQLMKTYISKVDNPYLSLRDKKKMFQRIRPYQLNALRSLASYNIINQDYLDSNTIQIKDKEQSQKFVNEFGTVSIKQQNLIKLLTSHFLIMPLNGLNGIKKKSGLMEYRYDIEPT